MKMHNSRYAGVKVIIQGFSFFFFLNHRTLCNSNEYFQYIFVQDNETFSLTYPCYSSLSEAIGIRKYCVVLKMEITSLLFRFIGGIRVC